MEYFEQSHRRLLRLLGVAEGDTGEQELIAVLNPIKQLHILKPGDSLEPLDPKLSDFFYLNIDTNTSTVVFSNNVTHTYFRIPIPKSYVRTRKRETSQQHGRQVSSEGAPSAPPNKPSP